MLCLACRKIVLGDDPVHGMHAACFYAEFQVESQADFKNVFEQNASVGKIIGPDVSAFQKFNSSFFHGRYRKYSGTLGENSYIIKMEQSEFPELPAVEFLCNQLAKIYGLPLPKFHFIKFQNQSYSFLSQNLMDIYAPATLDHIYKFLREDSRFDCETLAGIIQRETGRLADVHRFVEICLFDALIGNNDRHGRNIAFITRSNGRILAPFYDNPSYIGIADAYMLGADLSPRGTIITLETKEPLLKDYVKEFSRLGLNSATERFRQKVMAKKNAATELIRNATALSSARARALETLLEKRMREFENVNAQ